MNRSQALAAIDPAVSFIAQAVPIAGRVPVGARALRVASPVDLIVAFGTKAAALTAASFLVLAGNSEPVEVPVGASHVAITLAPPASSRGNRLVHLTPVA